MTIYDLRFTIYDLRITNYELRITIYELRIIQNENPERPQGIEPLNARSALNRAALERPQGIELLNRAAVH